MNTSKKRNYILVFLKTILLGNFCFAQNGLPNLSQISKNITPPGPNSVSLGKFGDYEVTPYNGTVGIGINFIPLKTKNGFQLPIGLSFNSSGLKVNEMPSSTGVNWTLNAGGAITRAIRGLDDFGMRGFIHNYFDANTVWLSQDPSLLGAMLYGAYDLQADLNNFNFAGYSGKFYFSRLPNPQVIVSPVQNLKINWLYNQQVGTASNNDVRFRVQDGNDNVYIFNDIELNQSYTTSSSGGVSNMEQYASAAYLTRIDLKNDEPINFNYTNSTLENYLTSVNSRISFLISAYSVAGGRHCYINQDSHDRNEILSKSYATSIQKILESISYRDYIIRFEYENYLLNFVESSNNVKRLKYIKYYYKNELFKVYELLYQSGGNNTRFWLTSLEEKNQQNQKINEHKFTYNNIELVPPRFSKRQDHWGYTNNNTATGTYLLTKLPVDALNFINCDQALYFHNQFFNSQNNCNRNPDQLVSTYGSLKEILNPLKGKTIFNFGAHTFTPRDGLWFGGGLRINSIANFEGEKLIKNTVYEYLGGKLMSIPTYHSIESRTNCNGAASIGYDPFIVTSSESRIQLSTQAKGSYVGYDQVNIIQADQTNSSNLGRVKNYFRNDYPTDLGSVTGNISMVLPLGNSNSSNILYNSQQYSDLGMNNGLLTKKEIMELIETGERIKVKEVNQYSILNSWNNNNQVYRTSCPPSTPNSMGNTLSYRFTDYFVHEVATKKTVEIFSYDNNTESIYKNETFYNYQNSLIKSTTTSSKLNSVSELFNYDQSENSIDFPLFNSNRILSYKKYLNNEITDERIYEYSSLEKNLIKETSLSSNKLNNLSGNNIPNKVINYHYDNLKNLIKIQTDDNEKESLIWDESIGEIILSATNAEPNQLVYSSFENKQWKGIQLNESAVVCSQTVKNGSCAYNLNGNPLNFSLEAQGEYVLTIWVCALNLSNLPSLRVNNQIVTYSTEFIGQNIYCEYRFNKSVSGVQTFQLSGNFIVDDILLRPINSSYKLYTIKPYYGISSLTVTDQVSDNYYYNIDGKLELIRDLRGNIINKIIYNLR